MKDIYAKKLIFLLSIYECYFFIVIIFQIKTYLDDIFWLNYSILYGKIFETISLDNK